MGSKMANKQIFCEGNDYYYGQRLSFDGALSTVRFFGPLASTKGEWLGIEWDDPSRGKHSGQFRGQDIFQCLSSSPTAASFVRPSRSTDPRKGFLEAVRFKYGDDEPLQISNGPARSAPSARITTESSIEISGKAVEEVGFDRIRRQQAQLENLKIVVLDSLCLAGVLRQECPNAEVADEQNDISRCCPNIIELDLGWNLLETLEEVAEICLPLKKLRILRLSGLRFRTLVLPDAQEHGWPFQEVEEIYLNECLFSTDQLLEVIQQVESFFPSLKTLSLSSNHLTVFPEVSISTPIKLITMILEDNKFESLECLHSINHAFPALQNLSLQGNHISETGQFRLGDRKTPTTYPGIETLNLSRNHISNYQFVDALPTIFPRLVSLNISNNPLYNIVTSASSGANQSRRTDAAYFLTLARMHNLKTLNYTIITPRDREEGEIYYLSIAEKDIEPSLQGAAPDLTTIAQAASAARAKYPRYEELCQLYDRDSLITRYLSNPPDLVSQTTKTSTYPPGSLGARLVKTTFHLPASSYISNSATHTLLLPRTIDVYRLKALLSRHFSLLPLSFSLIYESPELDPIRDDINQSTNWDDWGEWDVDDMVETSIKVHEVVTEKEKWVDGVLYKDGGKWKRREIELPDGFREWGFSVEEGVSEARIRIEMIDGGKRL